MNQKTYVLYVRNPLKYKDMCRLKENGWRKIHHVTTNWSKAGVALFLSDRTDFKARKAIRDKEGHYIFSKKT